MLHLYIHFQGFYDSKSITANKKFKRKIKLIIEDYLSLLRSSEKFNLNVKDRIDVNGCQSAMI